MRTQPLLLLPVAALTLAAAGCGGTIFPSNKPPTATFALVATNLETTEAVLPTTGAKATVVKVPRGSRVLVTCAAKDPDRDEVTYLWQGATPLTDHPEIAELDTATDGLRRITCVVTDSRTGGTTVATAGTSTDQAFFVQVVSTDNHAPKAVFEPETATVAPGGKIALLLRATDEDTGDTITYQFATSGGALESAGESGVTLTAPADPGKVTVFGTAIDNHGSASSALATITVKATSTP